MLEADATRARAALAALASAWARGDGEAFATVFTDDAEFVNILGAVLTGRAAIAAQHQIIFDTIYRGSNAAFDLVSLRRLAAGVQVAQVIGTVITPSGPRAGTTEGRITAVFIEDPEGWKIAALQNTFISGPPAAS